MNNLGEFRKYVNCLDKKTEEFELAYRHMCDAYWDEKDFDEKDLDFKGRKILVMLANSASPVSSAMAAMSGEVLKVIVEKSEAVVGDLEIDGVTYHFSFSRNKSALKEINAAIKKAQDGNIQVNTEVKK